MLSHFLPGLLFLGFCWFVCIPKAAPRLRKDLTVVELSVA